MSIDRHLLFGLLAVQMNFVTKEALIRAMNAWVLEKHKPLADLLRLQGAIAEDRCDLLEDLVHEHLGRNDNDLPKSLAALKGIEPIKEELSRIADPELQRSLGRLASLGPVATRITAVPNVVGNHTAESADFEMTQTQSPTASRPILEARNKPSHKETPHRFRVLRPHARGGLGEVFVAEDLELKREVALKEIQTKYSSDANSRGRFILEAEITGGLEHPGIVPVYGLGAYADGRPFYAMRFIRGDSLKEAIDKYHSTVWTDDSAKNIAFRNLLKRFIDVCNAIAYAHSRGILHRDLKPGNIMLGKYGETLVVDWGLAKSVASAPFDREHSQKMERENALKPSTSTSFAETREGSAVGTPAFMSPEQADGRLDELGPASDVYSLGATLYALSTGQPAVSGKTVHDVIRSVITGDFPPPIHVKPEIPRPLNAIILKAMANKPADRYPGAIELSNDLEQYLADEPVSAYRESYRERMRRWGRKHRSFVTAGAVLVGTATIGLSVGLFLVTREKNRTLQERNDKEIARLAEKKQREHAEASRNRALDVLDAMTSNSTRDSLITQQEIAPEQKKFLQEAYKYYLELAQEEGHDEADRKRRAEVSFRVGTIERRLGHKPEAQSSFARAAQLFDELASDRPNNADYRFQKARSLLNEGLVQFELSQFSGAIASFESAREIQEQLCVEDPQNGEYARQLARTLTNWASSLQKTGDRAKAQLSLRTAIALQEKLAASDPNPDYRNELAGSLNRLATGLLEQAKPTEAEPLLVRALEIRQTLIEEFPKESPYKDDLAECFVNLGIAYRDQGKTVEATTQLRRAIEQYDSLRAKYPTMPKYVQSLANCYSTLGGIQRRGGTLAPEEIRKTYQSAIDLQRVLVSTHPQIPDYRRDLARGLLILGGYLRAEKQPEEASSLYRESAKILSALIAELPSVLEYREDLAGVYTNLSSAASDRKMQKEAVEYARLAQDESRKMVESFPERASYRRSLATYSLKLARALRSNDSANSITTYSLAIGELERLRQLAPANVDIAKDLRDCFKERKDLYSENKESQKAESDNARIVELEISVKLGVAAQAAREGRVSAILISLNELAQNSGNWLGEQLFDLARVYALCAASDVDEAGNFAARAVETLQMASSKGFKDFSTLKSDPDWNAIRNRSAFKAFLAGLQQ